MHLIIYSTNCCPHKYSHPHADHNPHSDTNAHSTTRHNPLANSDTNAHSNFSTAKFLWWNLWL